MSALRRDRRWTSAGRVIAVVILLGLAGYLVHVGLDKADKLASSMSVLIALAALLAPYLLPAPQPGGPPLPDPNRVEDSGNATAAAGGQANTGLETTTSPGTRGAGRAQVARSGDARADGSGSVANTGIRHQPGSRP